MSDFDEKEQVACKVCGGAMQVAALECIGVVNGQLDLFLNCLKCGAKHNGFISFADFMEVE